MAPGRDGDRIGVPGGFTRQRGDVQPAQAHVRAFPAVVIGQLVSAGCRSDVDLDDHQVRFIVDIQALDVLVLDRDLVLIAQVCGQGCQAQGREERILDWPPVGAFGLGERGQDHFYLHDNPPWEDVL
ncbi:MAG: hypothetical protein P8Y03_00675 [Anaerolineales bacterium]